MNVLRMAQLALRWVEDVWAVVSEFIWSVQVIDGLMWMGVIVTVFCIFYIARGDRKHSQDATWPDRRHEVIETVAAAMVVLGVFVAYGSFRNQLKITAEIALNQEGGDLLSFEMERDSESEKAGLDSQLRCIYNNYGYVNPDDCLRRVTSNAASWSRTIFYVEESWFVLKKAQRDRLKWGSGYGKEIAYWAEDVSRDPTGIFSYYVVSSEDSITEARDTVESAGVCIPNLCDGYLRVIRALPPVARDRTRALVCVSPKDRQEATMHCKPHR